MSDWSDFIEWLAFSGLLVMSVIRFAAYLDGRADPYPVIIMLLTAIAIKPSGRRDDAT